MSRACSFRPIGVFGGKLDDHPHRLLDMMRTVPSASANLTVATTAARCDGEPDEAVYRAPDNMIPVIGTGTELRA